MEMVLDLENELLITETNVACPGFAGQARALPPR
jgi:hypothetical protein